MFGLAKTKAARPGGSVKRAMKSAASRKRGLVVAQATSGSLTTADVPRDADPQQPLLCGVLNTGELLIQTPYLSGRLKLAHWMELRDYLVGVKFPAQA